jgi:hypothetical protein
MTEPAYSASRSAEASHFGMQALWRLAMWGTLATFALFTAVLSTYSNAGSQRQAAAATSGQGTKPPRTDFVETRKRSAWRRRCAPFPPIATSC